MVIGFHLQTPSLKGKENILGFRMKTDSEFVIIRLLYFLLSKGDRIWANIWFSSGAGMRT